MIKANELRIGNYLNNDNILVKIDARSIFDIWDDNGLKKYKPIPLTEDWLLRFGFRKVMQKADYVTYSNGKKRISFYQQFIVMRNHGVTFKYVHQLQNLYWCLCGKELEINL